ncbi:uncharacterized protein LOC130808422 [Amaranthus tricolor]|uniref:uncharacterized protein LOC130808422 n=1 Tax=Amaranthus tricolor TaxID=29722 RepID=UPI002586C489|nr:uncharacterized protein LOC130808422 [Amaranthus tricolor]
MVAAVFDCSSMMEEQSVMAWCGSAAAGSDNGGVALKKIGRSKAFGPDIIPIEVRRALGIEGICWLTILFNVILCTLIERRIRQETLSRVNQFGIIHLDKVYDSIPRCIIWDSLKASGISQRYIEVIRDICDKVATNIQTPVGLTKSFPFKVGLHSGSALSPLIFTVIMEKISKSIWETVP